MNHVEFMNKIDSLHLPDAGRHQIELAYILAKDAHRAFERMGPGAQRYFEHPRRAALILIDEVGVSDADMICAALLHDTVEDTKYITTLKLQHWFNGRVAGLVGALTKEEGYTQRDYYDNLRGWSPATIVKGCDRLDNLRDLAHTEPDFQWKQLHGTINFVLPMLDKTYSTHGPYIAHAGKLIKLIEAEINKYPDLDSLSWPRNQGE